MVTFIKDIIRGFISNPKFILSKYFYDETGSKIFQEIMNMPEYYLTKSEFEIFETYSNQLVVEITNIFEGKKIDIFELGAGDGIKSKLLFKEFKKQKFEFTFKPIDISIEAINQLKTNIQSDLENIEIIPIIGDYFESLSSISSINSNPKLILFLGSNIGNMDINGSIEFLEKLNNSMNKGDLLLIGFDLMKNPQTILDAYNDKWGITNRFNLNLLSRINKQLGANFDLSKFEHYQSYDPISGRVDSYLISQKDQTVYIKEIDKEFEFTYSEAIHTEISQKYSHEMISKIAEKSGFTKISAYLDCKHYFTDELWIKE